MLFRNDSDRTISTEIILEHARKLCVVEPGACVEIPEELAFVVRGRKLPLTAVPREEWGSVTRDQIVELKSVAKAPPKIVRGVASGKNALDANVEEDTYGTRLRDAVETDEAPAAPVDDGEEGADVGAQIALSKSTARAVASRKKAQE